MAQLVIYLLLLIAAVHGGRHAKYEGHQLFRVTGSAKEISYLNNNLDILSAHSAARSTSGQLEALVRISPEQRHQWLDHFKKNSISYTKVFENLADILREEDAMISKSRAFMRAPRVGDDDNDDGDEPSSDASSQEDKSDRSSKEVKPNSEANTVGWDALRWNTYYHHEEINAFLDDLGAKYPKYATVINADLSYEGRPIKYVMISTSDFKDRHKPVIVIDATMHAREWIATPVAMYIINQLVVDVVDSELIERLDWVIIPLANPDGYEYTKGEDRFWRKTRSMEHPGSSECPGVDINRNFDHYWGTDRQAANICTVTYEGPSAFSEVEARVIRDVIVQLINKVAMYISLHSFGSYLLYPWGNNGTPPSNGETLHLVGVRMASAIDKLALKNAKRYTVGNTAQVIYASTGTSRDWARAAGVLLSYTIELPSYGEWYFSLPPKYIKQVVTETWAGIVEGAKYIISL